MARELVGFYQTRETADRAYKDLLSAGFDRNDVHMYSGKDGPGLWDDIKEWFGFADEEDRHLYHEAARRGAVAVVVDLDDEDSPSGQTALQVLQRHGPIDLEQQSQQWRTQGWQGSQRSAQGTTSTTGRSQQTTRKEGQESVPVVEEQLNVGKRQIEKGGLRIHTHVTRKPVQAQVNLREEHAHVERRPVDRPVSDADKAFKERSIEVTETSERPVVSKEARVVEEVNVRKDVDQRTETVRDTVRRTDVDVEKTGGQHARDADIGEFAQEFCHDERYRGRTWTTVESDARRTFEQRYPGRKWDQYRDTVRQCYEERRQQA
jgi:uncharacterized protein (TIGR02271 family)